MSEPFKSLEEIHLALNVCWSFDDDQQHTHTWHDKQDFLDRLTLTLQTHELREKGEITELEREKVKLQHLLTEISNASADDGMTGEA